MNKKMVAIFDMDDTLSDTSHRRHLIETGAGVKKEWSKFFELCHEDTERSWMIERALELQKAGVLIAIFTGRPQSVAPATLSWLGGPRRQSRLGTFSPMRRF